MSDHHGGAKKKMVSGVERSQDPKSEPEGYEARGLRRQKVTKCDKSGLLRDSDILVQNDSYHSLCMSFAVCNESRPF